MKTSMSKQIHPNPLAAAHNIETTPMHISSRPKLPFVLLTLFAVVLAAAALLPSAFAAEKKLVAIIVPSPENPFFKALAD